MPIDGLTASSFTAFEEIAIPLDPGINVFIGPNGTGKTHVMKLLYAALRSIEAAEAPSQTPALLEEKLAAVFRPDGASVGRLVRRVRGKGQASVAVSIDQTPFRFTLHQTARSPVRAVTRTRMPSLGSVFLPSREVLSLFEGFSALYQARALSIDETYADAIAALDLPPLRGPRAGVLGDVARDLETAIRARVRRDGPRFYLRETSGAKIEAHLVAEGHRKIATILQLISNGALRDRAVLFWDEPEANLHPLLAEWVVDAIHKLAVAGVQIVLATHDYLVASRISLRATRRGAASARFFAFSPTKDVGVRISTSPSLKDLDEDLLLTAIRRHTEFQRSIALEQAEG